jgi:hypothetical protein
MPVALGKLLERRQVDAAPDRGVDERLGGDGRSAAVARSERERRAQKTAGAVAAHSDAVAVDREPVGVVAEPRQHAVAVVECRRIRMLGRQAVVDADDRGGALIREAPRVRVRAFEIAEPEPAPVQVDDAGTRRGHAGRLVYTHHDIPVRRRHGAVVHGHAGGCGCARMRA